MASVKLTLAWPPSVNHYYQRTGRGFVAIGPRGRAYRAAVHAAVLEQCPGAHALQGPLEFRATCWPPDRRERDLDNLIKATWDALQHAGVYTRDNQIKVMRMEMRAEVRKGGEMQIEILEAA